MRVGISDTHTSELHTKIGRLPLRSVTCLIVVFISMVLVMCKKSLPFVDYDPK